MRTLHRPIIAAGAAIAVLFSLLYGDVLAGLAETWNEDPNVAYGWLVPALSGWLLWSRRNDLKSAPIRPSGAGLAVLVAAIALLFFGRWTWVTVLQRISPVIAIHGIVLALFGGVLYRRAAFPLFFLFLMVPPPITITGAVTLPLQRFAAISSAGVLNGVGIETLREGNVLYLKSGALEVAEACSGLRSVLSLLTAGVFLAGITPIRLRYKLGLIASTAPIALAANVARITFSGVVATGFGQGAVSGGAHDYAGLVAFGIGLTLFLFERRAFEAIHQRGSAA